MGSEIGLECVQVDPYGKSRLNMDKVPGGPPTGGTIYLGDSVKDRREQPPRHSHFGQLKRHVLRVPRHLLECSPKPDPHVMRVLTALLGKETFDEEEARQAAYAGTDY